MWLYLGYLLVQTYPLINKLAHSNMATSAVIFSIAVFFIWAFIPVSGYFLAKLLKADGFMHKYSLLILGIVIAMIENSLFYLDILRYDQSLIGILVIFILFFISAYISIGKSQNT
ncbi:hypothetical protein [Thalassotalea profundi]|uniref:Uncharacterized protein n=1 Tax=Thalassotalea profundi TaxID=2036687 RepID=A0ABQ3IBF6_9GAMM|nr:hypothetical protein [Thalassotalea profundi]GHE77192.1 hypothetical protein GCM10011501_00800 [Thalassotalea profundi]